MLPIVHASLKWKYTLNTNSIFLIHLSTACSKTHQTFCDDLMTCLSLFIFFSSFKKRIVYARVLVARFGKVVELITKPFAPTK
jgi:hypothetical protein